MFLSCFSLLNQKAKKKKSISSCETARIFSIIKIWHQKWRLVFEPLTSQCGSACTFLCRPTPRSPETPGRLKHIQKHQDVSLILEQVVGRSRTGLLPTWPLLVFSVKPTGNVCYQCYLTKIMILTQTAMFSSTSPNCECNTPIQSFIYEDVFENHWIVLLRHSENLPAVFVAKTGYIIKETCPAVFVVTGDTKNTNTIFSQRWSRSKPDNIIRTALKWKLNIKTWKVSTYQWFAGT